MSDGPSHISSDARLEQAASMMYAAALAFTDTIGRSGWAWELCDEETKDYWRNIAALVQRVFDGP